MNGINIVRTENKYLVDEATAQAIAARIAHLCCRDVHTPAGGRDYPIHSLYFDTPRRTCYQANKFKQRERMKLRVRCYDEVGPLWLEVKHKSGNRVSKHRQRLERHRWPGVLSEISTFGTANGFLGEVQRLGCEPVCRIHYEREAWVGMVDDYLRITFDREVRSAPAWGDATLPDDPGSAALIDDPWATNSAWGGSPVILEIKCEALAPRWVAGLVESFRLVPQGLSKYVMAIESGTAPFRRRPSQAVAKMWRS